MSIEFWGARKTSGVAIASTALAMFFGSTAAVAQKEATPAPVSIEELKAEGASVYRYRCAKCHGQAGEGQRHRHDAAPRLSGSFARLSVRTIAVQVIRGGSYMPPFYSLTNREIAAVATYIRNSFGNSHGIATEEEVAENRSELQEP